MGKEHAQNTMGQLIGDEAERDAIHIALAPVMAVTYLHPGQAIGFAEEGDSQRVTAPGSAGSIGIVDPFLKERVKPGDRFWMFLYPNTITGLSHKWEHPAFDAQAVKFVTDKLTGVDVARAWIKDFAKSHDEEYEDLMEAAEEFASYGEYYVKGGKFEGSSVPAEFWEHYEKVRGVEVEQAKKGNFFSCSC